MDPALTRNSVKELKKVKSSKAIKVLGRVYPGLVGIILECIDSIEKAEYPTPLLPGEPDILDALTGRVEAAEWVQKMAKFRKKTGWKWNPSAVYQAGVHNFNFYSVEKAYTAHYVKNGLSLYLTHDTPASLSGLILPRICGVGIMGVPIKIVEI